MQSFNPHYDDCLSSKMIYYSSEIRWFSDKGKTLLNLFNAFPGKSSATQARTDRYLNRKSESIGIKIREGRMEIKLLVGSHKHTFKRQRWIIEDWVKCSYEDSAASLQNLGKIDSDIFSWIDILKKRKQKKFVLSGKTVRPVDFDEQISQGCTVEYTSLKVHKTIPYYTLGFEAFGKDNQASHRNLTTMLNYSETYIQPNALKEIICGGYARFFCLF